MAAMNPFLRIERLERSLRRTRRGGSMYTMRNGSQRFLSFHQALKGYSDATSRIDSPEARIILNAVTDNNNGLMLKLLHAVLNPVDTETEETQHEQHNDAQREYDGELAGCGNLSIQS
jgi:hypothetical protein